MRLFWWSKKLRWPRKSPKFWAVSGTVTLVMMLAVGSLLLITGRHKDSMSMIMAGKPIVDKCQTDKTLTYSCYKNELDTIVARQGPEQAFMLVKDEYTKQPIVKSLCHQLTHVIGRAAYAKYDNLAETFGHGDQFCWSGYYHGVMEQIAVEKGASYIVTNANNICTSIATKQKYSFYHYNCVHGLGHGFMEVLNANLFDSLKACDRLSDNWEEQSCYGGVFMQNIMNVQSPDNTVDHTSKYLKADQPMYPCTAVADKYKEQCYLMQTSYALQVKSYNFAAVFNLCKDVDSQYVDTCYQSLGRDASGQSVSDAVTTKSTCMLGDSEEARENCVIGASKDFVSYYHSDVQAKQLCNSLDDTLKTVCNNTVTSYYSTF